MSTDVCGPQRRTASHPDPSPRNRLLAAMVAVVALAAACGGPETTAGTDGDATVSPVETETAAQPPADGSTATAKADATEDVPAPTTVAEVLEAVDGLDRDARRQQLRTMAEDEDGPVLLYTSMSQMTDMLPQVQQALDQATGLELEVYRAGGEEVRSRLLEEAQAGRHEVDIIETAGRMLEQLAEEGVIARYESPYRDDLISDAAQESWTTTRLNVYTVAWNSELVEQPPTTYADLGDDRWDGRLILEPTDFDWYWAVSQYWADEEGLSQEQIAEQWLRMADNASFQKGHSSGVEFVGSGEYHVMASAFAPTVERNKNEGMAVEWLPPVEPLFATPNAAAVYKDTEQPASAVLFMDWLFSDGMELLQENGFFVTRQDLQDPLLEGLDIRLIDIDTYLPLEPEVMASYEALAEGLAP